MNEWVARTVGNPQSISVPVTELRDQCRSLASEDTVIEAYRLAAENAVAAMMGWPCLMATFIEWRRTGWPPLWESIAPCSLPLINGIVPFDDPQIGFFSSAGNFELIHQGTDWRQTAPPNSGIEIFAIGNDVLATRPENVVFAGNFGFCNADGYRLPSILAQAIRTIVAHWYANREVVGGEKTMPMAGEKLVELYSRGHHGY